MNFIKILSGIFLLIIGHSCSGHNGNSKKIINDTIPAVEPSEVRVLNDEGLNTIHVFVALCDNKYQGIVPVPVVFGNGQDPKNNLYWGAAYGIKSYFVNKSNDWKLISEKKNISEFILERLLFKHRFKNVYLLADAYDGQFIKQTTIDFLNASSGKNECAIEADVQKVYFGGAANLIAYMGHDGLMDFSLQHEFNGDISGRRETIILACFSKNFFSKYLRTSGSNPLLWTSGLMAPEAYTLHDAIREWVNEGTPQQIRTAAASAYSKYQRCSFKAAQNLLVQGW